MNIIKKYKLFKEFRLLQSPICSLNISEISTDLLIEIYIEVMEELYKRDDFNSTKDLQISYGIIKNILDKRGVTYV